MSACSCARFRAELERLLHSRRSTDELAELSWNEHLLACTACRALLDAEEALEALLASLPAPSLPPALARRVLARLRRDGERLDELLALDAPTAADRELARRVLARLAPRRRALAQRELERPARVVRPRVAFGWAAALLVALGAAAWLVDWPASAPADRSRGGADDGRIARVEPDAELLAHLDLLADDALWELLTGDDVDLVLGSLETADALLLVEDAADALSTDVVEEER